MEVWKLPVVVSRVKMLLNGFRGKAGYLYLMCTHSWTTALRPPTGIPPAPTGY